MTIALPTGRRPELMFNLEATELQKQKVVRRLQNGGCRCTTRFIGG
jgi:hypothetical protein